MPFDLRTSFRVLSSWVHSVSSRTSPAPWIKTNGAMRYVFGCTKKVSSGSVPGGQPG
jgi:hypothetical protein